MPSAVAWDLHYDRRVTDEFLAHFLEGGVAHPLVEYARFAAYPLDLQMRYNPKTGAEHGSLYVGLSTVLDVHRRKDRLLLKAHGTYMNGPFGFRQEWTSPMTVAELRKQWRKVEDYLESVIPEATRTHAGKEGPVQAAASVFSSRERVMVDREVTLHFRDGTVRKQILGEITEPFVKAVQGIAGVEGRPPSSFGDECDLLALDEHGRLLAVEIKPEGVGTIAWASAQATVYAQMLERWVRTKPQGTDHPLTILRGMLDQRARLGLAPLQRPGIPERPEVVPVVAIGRGEKSKTYLDRMKTVQRALLDAGVGNSALEVYEVSLAGRLHRLF
jgi:hypothetical protein